MKLKSVVLACAFLSGAQVFAQSAVVTPPSASGKPAMAVNPFTGKPLSDEQLQRELETAKMHTAYLEEMLKQTNLNAEIKTLPMRKAVESAQAETSLKREVNSKMELEESRKAAAAAKALELAQLEQQLKEAKSKLKKSSPKSKKVAGDTIEVVEDAAAAPQPAPTSPIVQLTSVLDIGGVKSAVFDLNGGTLVLADGADSPLGQIRVVDSSSVEVNGRTYKVHQATLGRVVLSDSKSINLQGVPAGSAEAARAPGSNVTTALNARMQSTQVTGGSIAKPLLPPLQMPPGAQTLPGVPAP